MSTDPGMAQPHGHSVDEYLETIYFLAFPIGEYRPATGSTAIASRVAEMLGVSRASAGEMLKRLEADGLVERGEQKEAILTPEGTERARRVVRKHRIIERFLTDFMGYTAARVARPRRRARRHVHRRHDRAHQRAARRPRALPARLAGRSRVRAGRERGARRARGAPGRSRRPRSSASRSTTATSCTGSTTRASCPGSQVAVVSAQPAAGQLTITLDGAERADHRDAPPTASTSAPPSRSLRFAHWILRAGITSPCEHPGDIRNEPRHESRGVAKGLVWPGPFVVLRRLLGNSQGVLTPPRLDRRP